MQPEAKISPWISAWTDSVAGLHSMSQLMNLTDLSLDGDFNLVIADLFDFNKQSKLTN